MIFYISLYRVDAKKLEEWARAQNPTSLVDFSSREGEVEGILKDIAERAGGKGDFSYSRFFAIGLFRLLELANAMEPTILEKVTQFIYGIMIYWFDLIHIFCLYNLKFELPSLVPIYTSSRKLQIQDFPTFLDDLFLALASLMGFTPIIFF